MSQPASFRNGTLDYLSEHGPFGWQATHLFLSIFENINCNCGSEVKLLLKSWFQRTDELEQGTCSSLRWYLLDDLWLVHMVQ